MIYKRCPHCGRRIPSGKTCQCYKYAMKDYTARWKKLSAYIISKAGGLDLWAQYNGRIEYATIVHHIVPADENSDLFFLESNLIPVSRASHQEIHKLYARSDGDKKHTQDILRSLVHQLGVS